MRILRRLKGIWRSNRLDQDLRDELEFHRAQVQDALERRGVSSEEAAIESRRRMGNVALAREDARQIWISRHVDALRQDVRYTIRTLARDPLFSALSLLTLCLGIGATTAIFSIVYAVALAPLPYRDPAALVVIRAGDMGSHLSLEQYRALAAQSRSFSNVAAARFEMSRFAGDDARPRIPDFACTENLFELLGVPAELGRTFGARDAGQRVAVLSHEWWIQRFGGDARVIGKSISLDDTPYEVIGVMPPAFRFPYQRQADVWIPADEGAKAHMERSGVWLTVARLRAGTSLTAARSELTVISDRLALDREYAERRLNVLPMLDDVLGVPVKTRLLVLLGAVALVLLIACVNVASLLLTRSRARSREFAVRAAIGAGRWRIVRQLFTEASLISVVAGAAGVLLAHWTLASVIALIPSGIPRVDSIRINAAVLVCASIVSLSSGFLTGLLPAWRLSRRPLHDELKTGAARKLPTGAARSGALFVFAETSLAVILLVGAGLMIRSFSLLGQVDAGFSTGNLVAIGLSGQQSVPTVAELRERALRLPGVMDATAADLVPFQGSTRQSDLEVQGRPATPFDMSNVANVETVMPGYFRMLAIDVVRGRVFTPDDRLGARLVAVINEAAVRKYFPNEDPIGLRIYSGFGWNEVIGIVKDVHWFSLAQDAPPAMYFPMLQLPPQYANGAELLLRLDPSSRTTMGQLKNDANILFAPLARVLDVQSMDALIARSVQQWKFQAVLLGTFGALALVLAVIGIFGVNSYAVVQRTHEIGVRLALGASRRDMLELIVLSAARPVIAGLAAGLLGAAIGTRTLAAFLFRLHPTDPPTYAAMSGLFLAVALCAAMIPAYRATKVDPVITLRHE